MSLRDRFVRKTPDLTRRPGEKDDKNWPAYNSVKKWTKGKNVFSKKLLIVPICEQ